MSHHLDRAIASDVSYQVLQRRQREFQLSAPEPDSRLRRLYPITAGYERHAFMADRETVPDSYQCEARKFFGRE